jgi:hypothetical protein
MKHSAKVSDSLLFSTNFQIILGVSSSPLSKKYLFIGDQFLISRSMAKDNDNQRVGICLSISSNFIFSFSKSSFNSPNRLADVENSE